ncbi:MAG: UDP-N-acetylmuramoyl-L-alanyl-D-glutamate--2,6-diaminopimelate ligase [Myxococcales bacterium]|nr:UDP-N-acetylmuramoyl-L-alanyl-D-glutamate--2,6-diaminopimelate ligase [Myxococcales bacterium]
MLLVDVLKQVQSELKPVHVASGWEDLHIDHVTINSQKVGPSSLFVACKGVLPTSKDGHEFIEKAIAQGAAGVVLESLPENVSTWSVPVWQSENTRRDVARLAEVVWGSPASELTTIGITGTNGKSSVAFGLSSLLTAMDLSCGVMGTLGFGRPEQLEDWGMTTPEAEVLSARLRQLVEQKFQAVAMEVSSHGLATSRVAGVEFDVAVFTNLTHEHLDFHGNFDAYYEAKKTLFTQHALASSCFVIPHDGEIGARLNDDLAHLPQRKITWGQSTKADVWADNVVLNAQGISMTLQVPDGAFEIAVPWLGAFHVENILAIAAVAHAMGFSGQRIQKAFEQVAAPPGRMEVVAEARSTNLPTTIVDYAHTPDALESALVTLKEICEGEVWVIFGCGGDRDQAKRPLMGEVASRLSHRTVITNDNPRSEDPATIASAIATGIQKQTKVNTIAEMHCESYCVVLDRRRAIAQVIAQADAKDMVLIAGKGHEKKQITGNSQMNFDDAEVAQNALRERGH